MYCIFYYHEIPVLSFKKSSIEILEAVFALKNRKNLCSGNVLSFKAGVCNEILSHPNSLSKGTTKFHFSNVNFPHKCIIIGQKEMWKIKINGGCKMVNIQVKSKRLNLKG